MEAPDRNRRKNTAYKPIKRSFPALAEKQRKLVPVQSRREHPHCRTDPGTDIARSLNRVQKNAPNHTNDLRKKTEAPETGQWRLCKSIFS